MKLPSGTARRVLIGAVIAALALACLGAGVLAGKALDGDGPKKQVAAAPAGATPSPVASKAVPTASRTPTPESGGEAPESTVVTIAATATRAGTGLPTQGPRTITSVPSTPSSPQNVVTPVGRSAQEELQSSDLASRGTGQPGRGALNADRIIITGADVDAELVTGVVADSSGQLPQAPTKEVAIWYDFSGWPDLGGAPGRGGNIVIAGDAGRYGEGPGVFWRLGRLVAGDYVRLRTTDGTLCYRVEFNKIAVDAVSDFTEIVTATADESVTLITAGRNPSEREIVWARSASCSREPAATPTRSPQPGHQQLRIVAEHSRFTSIEGNTIPVPIHTVDILFDNLDDGVTHHIVFYDPSGAEYFDAQEVVGPIIGWVAYMPAGPRTGSDQHYTFRCVIHPATMQGSLTIK